MRYFLNRSGPYQRSYSNFKATFLLNLNKLGDLSPSNGRETKKNVVNLSTNEYRNKYILYTNKKLVISRQKHPLRIKKTTWYKKRRALKVAISFYG